VVRRIEDRDVLRHHDGRALDIVVERAVLRDDANLVVRVDVAQFAEERIAMTGEPEIAWVARQRGARM
jgi:hypothetical protein